MCKCSNPGPERFEWPRASRARFARSLSRNGAQGTRYEIAFEAEPFRRFAEFDKTELAQGSLGYGREAYAPSEETGLLRMIETGKVSQHCFTLWGDFCKALKEWRRTSTAVENKKWVIDHEEFKLKRWRCADASLRRPDQVKRICKDLSDKVERLKSELPQAEAEQQQATAVYRALVNRLTNECRQNINTLVCPG